MKIYEERVEKYTEGKDEKWRAKEEANGTHKNNQPSVENSRPLAGHSNSGCEMGVWPWDTLVA